LATLERYQHEEDASALAAAATLAVSGASPAYAGPRYYYGPGGYSYYSGYVAAPVGSPVGPATGVASASGTVAPGAFAACASAAYQVAAVFGASTGGLGSRTGALSILPHGVRCWPGAAEIWCCSKSGAIWDAAAVAPPQPRRQHVTHLRHRGQ
jgi:hypothetical protein